MCSVFDADGIEDGMNMLTEEGIFDEVLCSMAQDILDNLGDKDWVLAEIKEQRRKLASAESSNEASEVVEVVQTGLDNLQFVCSNNNWTVPDDNEELTSFDPQAQQPKVDDKSESNDVSKGDAKGDAKGSDKGGGGNSKTTRAEHNSTSKEFGDLSKLKCLKDPDVWGGHRAERCFCNGKRNGKRVMLVHSKSEMISALTRLAAENEEVACLQFNDIQGWMGDRLVPESQRVRLLQAIINRAKGDLVEETFVQVMKQLSPSSPTARASGWQLLLACLQQLSLKQDLRGFLLKFVENAQTAADAQARLAEDSDAMYVAKECLEELNMEEADKENSIFVLLIDGSKRRVRVQDNTTLSQLCKVVADRLNIKADSRQDFAIFQRTKGLSQDMLRSPETLVSDCLKHFQKLKEYHDTQDTDSGASYFVFKRKILTQGETLKTHDFMHASLTYKQAVKEYLEYRMEQDPTTFINVGAYILWADKEDYMEYIDQRFLHQDLVSQLLPASLAARLGRGGSEKILKQYASVFPAQGQASQAAKIDKWNSALKNIQMLDHFGGYWWSVTQVDDVGKDQRSLDSSRLPVKMLKLPVKKCLFHLDDNAVHFVGSETAGDPLKVFLTFQFDPKDADERIVDSGAKKDSLQLVVTLKDGKTRSILLEAKSALDIQSAMVSTNAEYGKKVALLAHEAETHLASKKKGSGSSKNHH